MTPPSPEQILNDPACSFWLKEALEKSLTRDPVDALNDSETLVADLQGRLNNLLGRG